MSRDSAKKGISRTLQLKPIKFSELKDGNTMTLTKLMAIFAGAYPTVGSRTDTTGITLATGETIPQLCTFFNNYQALDDNTCIFEIWSYEPGTIPQTLTPDPNMANAVTDNIISDSDEEEHDESEPKKRIYTYCTRACIWAVGDNRKYKKHRWRT